MNAESVELNIYGRAAHLVLGGKREENPSRRGINLVFYPSRFVTLPDGAYPLLPSLPLLTHTTLACHSTENLAGPKFRSRCFTCRPFPLRSGAPGIILYGKSVRLTTFTLAVRRYGGTEESQCSYPVRTEYNVQYVQSRLRRYAPQLRQSGTSRTKYSVAML
jgi:hypothetical protein